MPITIIMPDGAQFQPKGPDIMALTHPHSSDFTGGATTAVGADPNDHLANSRTIATVAAELEAAILASTRVKALTEELHALLGRKKRGPRKAV